MPADVRPSHPDLHTIVYGNHRSAREHADVVRKKLKDDVRRDRTLIFNLSDARKIRGFKLSPLGALFPRKVRIIHDYTFSPVLHGRDDSSVNANTAIDAVPPCLFALLALPKLKKEFVRLR